VTCGGRIEACQPVGSDHDAVVAAYFVGVNAGDFRSVAELFDHDATLRAPGGPPLHGRTAIEGYYQRVLAPFPRHLDIPTRVVSAATTATVEITFEGATKSGVAVSFDALDVFDFDREGRIVSLSSWYDSHDVHRQFHAVPEAGA
jgi:ketosteroid isomerase-like protein